MSIETWYKWSTLEFTLTVVFGGELRDLRDFDAIELVVKRHLGETQTALVTLGIGSGITLQDQDEADGLGKADVVIPSDAWDGVAAGHVWVDVFGIFNGSPPVRKLIVQPTYKYLSDVCNDDA